MTSILTEVLVNDIMEILKSDEWVNNADISSNGYTASLSIKKETKKFIYCGSHDQLTTALTQVTILEDTDIAEQAKCFLEEIA